MNNKTTTINLKREYSAPTVDMVQLEPGTLFRAPFSGSNPVNLYEEVVEPVPADESNKDIWGVQW